MFITAVKIVKDPLTVKPYGRGKTHKLVWEEYDYRIVYEVKKNLNSALRFELFLCEDGREYPEFIRVNKSGKKRESC
jgi:hypothetical protein